MIQDYYGLPTGNVSSPHLQLDYLTQSGPRIVRAILPGITGNLFAETPTTVLDTPYGPFHLHGGHRLWAAPESKALTYVPDEGSLEVQLFPGGVLLSQPPNAAGVGKSLEIHLSPARASATVVHTLQNFRDEPLEVAAWALTQLPLGGVAIIPQTVGALDDEGLLPNRNLALWPYTRWSDIRLNLNEDFVLVSSDAQSSHPCKIGMLNRAGWVGYLRHGILFRKRFDPYPDASHVDFDCNVEVYTYKEFTELETLSPLVQLKPGETVIHTEIWDFYTGVGTTDGKKITIDHIRDVVSKTAEL